MHLNMKYPEIGRLMMAYDKKFKAFMKTALRKRELTVAEMLVMLSLSEADGQTQDQLLSQISYDKSVMPMTLIEASVFSFFQRTETPAFSNTSESISCPIAPMMMSQGRICSSF